MGNSKTVDTELKKKQFEIMVGELKAYANFCDKKLAEEKVESPTIHNLRFYETEIIDWIYDGVGAGMESLGEDDDHYVEMLEAVEGKGLDELFFNSWKTREEEAFEKCARFLLDLGIIPFWGEEKEFLMKMKYD